MKANRPTSTIFAMIALFSSSCDRPHSKPNMEETVPVHTIHQISELGASQAKQAILDLIKTQRWALLAGWVDTIEKNESKPDENGRIRFGPITCDLNKRTFVLSLISPPHLAEYEGEFRLVDGQWKAVVTGTIKKT